MELACFGSIRLKYRFAQKIYGLTRFNCTNKNNNKLIVTFHDAFRFTVSLKIPCELNVRVYCARSSTCMYSKYTNLRQVLVEAVEFTLR